MQHGENHVVIFHSPSPCSTLRWRHDKRDGVSNHQPHDCLLNRLFRRRSKKNSKLLVISLYDGEFMGDRWIPRKRASDAEDVSIFDDVIISGNRMLMSLTGRVRLQSVATLAIIWSRNGTRFLPPTNIGVLCKLYTLWNIITVDFV